MRNLRLAWDNLTWDNLTWDSTQSATGGMQPLIWTSRGM